MRTPHFPLSMITPFAPILQGLLQMPPPAGKPFFILPVAFNLFSFELSEPLSVSRTDGLLFNVVVSYPPQQMESSLRAGTVGLLPHDCQHNSSSCFEDLLSARHCSRTLLQILTRIFLTATPKRWMVLFPFRDVETQVMTFPRITELGCGVGGM